MDELTTVCDRCGAEKCVGKEACDYDGGPHGVVEVPSIKVLRNAPNKMVKGGQTVQK